MCSPVTDPPQTERTDTKENDVRPKREDPHETPSHISLEIHVSRLIMPDKRDMNCLLSAVLTTDEPKLDEMHSVGNMKVSISSSHQY